MTQPIVWKNNKLFLLDQRLLPHEEKIVEISSIEGTYHAIQDMVVRGAPCIGFTGIFGMALWIAEQKEFNFDNFVKKADYLKSSRPTAVNLAFEIDRVVLMVKDMGDKKPEAILKTVIAFGLEQIHLSDIRNNKMADYVIEELTSLYGNRPLNVMTHCNTGYLACGSLGTALGVISKLHKLGRINHVYADETRPYMQGTRLTAYELGKENIPHDIVVEGAASYIMREKKIDAIFVGADRIVKNGDTANKVGTSTLAIVAKHYKVPFFVVAPVSSFDLKAKTGHEIEIEMRSPLEILDFAGKRVAPHNSRATNPSFDVTESSLIHAISCEKGLIKSPYETNLIKVVNS